MQDNVNNNTVKTLRWHHEVVNFIYNIQVMRISKGYTQKELSFLLGLPDNRVANIERFTNGREYTILDISLLTKIFECPVKDLFHPGKFPSEWLKMEVYRDRGRDGSIIHRAFAVQENGKTELLYSLMEKPVRLRGVAGIVSSIKKSLDHFITGGYFAEGADVLEIFMDLKKILNGEFRPKHLQKALNSYTLKDAASGLKRLLEDGHYYYFTPSTFS